MEFSSPSTMRNEARERLTGHPVDFSIGSNPASPSSSWRSETELLGSPMAWESPTKASDHPPQWSHPFGIPPSPAHLGIAAAAAIAASTQPGSRPESSHSLQQILQAAWGHAGGWVAQTGPGDTARGCPPARIVARTGGSWAAAAAATAAAVDPGVLQLILVGDSQGNESIEMGGSCVGSDSGESERIIWRSQARASISGEEGVTLQITGSASSSCSRMMEIGQQHSGGTRGGEDAVQSPRTESDGSASMSSSVNAAWRVGLLEESLAAAVAAAVAEAEGRSAERLAEQAAAISILQEQLVQSAARVHSADAALTAAQQRSEATSVERIETSGGGSLAEEAQICSESAAVAAAEGEATSCEKLEGAEVADVVPAMDAMAEQAEQGVTEGGESSELAGLAAREADVREAMEAAARMKIAAEGDAEALERHAEQLQSTLEAERDEAEDRVHELQEELLQLQQEAHAAERRAELAERQTAEAHRLILDMQESLFEPTPECSPETGPRPPRSPARDAAHTPASLADSLSEVAAALTYASPSYQGGAKSLNNTPAMPSHRSPEPAASTCEEPHMHLNALSVESDAITEGAGMSTLVVGLPPPPPLCPPRSLFTAMPVRPGYQTGGGARQGLETHTAPAPCTVPGSIMGGVPAVAASADSDTWWRTADQGVANGDTRGGKGSGGSGWGPEASNRLRSTSARRTEVAGSCVEAEMDGEDDGGQSRGEELPAGPTYGSFRLSPIAAPATPSVASYSSPHGEIEPMTPTKQSDGTTQISGETSISRNVLVLAADSSTHAPTEAVSCSQSEGPTSSCPPSQTESNSSAVHLSITQGMLPLSRLLRTMAAQLRAGLRAWNLLLAAVLRRCASQGGIQLQVLCRMLKNVLMSAWDAVVWRPMLAALVPAAGAGLVGVLWYAAVQRARRRGRNVLFG